MSDKSELRQRNRTNFQHHPPLNAEVADAHQAVRLSCMELADRLVELCPESRELSLALTNLEQVMMWANAAIARNPS